MCHLYELGLVVADTSKNEKENNLYGIFRNVMKKNEELFVEKIKKVFSQIFEFFTDC